MELKNHNLLTPKFFTTDFDEVARLDYSSHEPELEAMLAELKSDYNHHIFIDKSKSDELQVELNEEEKQALFEFFYRSCLSEFSGFLLYKELGKRLKKTKPNLAECFDLMARDEARHSGILNKAMSKLGVYVNLGVLAKKRKYVFFKPKFIYYAVFLSEKLGHFRYDVLSKYLENHPDKIVSPLFKILQPWCLDESRHGDFFAFVLKSQSHLLKGWKAKLWCRFFLLSHFAMLYVRDLQESNFFALLGMDPRPYNREVIQKTNATAGKVYPVVLNVDSPEFFQRLDICAENNDRLNAIDNRKELKAIKFCRQLPLYLSNIWQLVRLFLMKPIETDILQNTVM